MNLKEFGVFLSKKREESGFPSQRQLALASGVSNGTIARIEGGTQKASPETLKKLAPFLKGIDYEALMVHAGYIDDLIDLVNVKAEKDETLPASEREKYKKLIEDKIKEKEDASENDEKDIAKRLEQIRKDIENSDGLAFDGDPLSDEAKESVMEAMEFIVRQTKKINEKYIPKKYREKEKE